MNTQRIESGFRISVDGKCARSAGGMVVSAFPEATRAGLRMLEAGGNAADAACAAALALCVCEPQASGLGGQSTALVHTEGRSVTLDGSGRVPALFPEKNGGQPVSPDGYRATTVPTTPAVVCQLHRAYGRLDWPRVVAPAVAVARDGYRITALQHRLQQRERSHFQQVPSASGARYFLKSRESAYLPGERFRQPELADLLALLAEAGAEAFYTGEPARIIDADMRKNGGYLRADDLGDIPWPVERPCIETPFRGLRVVTTPPPTGGRDLLAVLRVLDRMPPDFTSADTPSRHRFLLRLFQRILALRRDAPADYRRYRPESDPLLGDDRWARAFAKQSGGGPIRPMPAAAAGAQGETTHLSVMDSGGMTVGITQSINLVFGSRAAARGLGFLYNNYLLDLDRTDPAHPHYLKAGNAPWSFACPTLVFAGGKPWLLTGSPGSDRIITTVAQFLVHVIDGGLPLDRAVAAPRLHCRADGAVSLEADGFDPELTNDLRRRGHEVTLQEPRSFFHGAIHAALRQQDETAFQGAAEIRRDGTAAGP